MAFLLPWRLLSIALSLILIYMGIPDFCFCDQDDNLDLELRLGQPGAASASQHEDPLVYKRGSTTSNIMAYLKRAGGATNTLSAKGLAKSLGVDTATEIELDTQHNIIYQLCIVDEKTSLKQAKRDLLEVWKRKAILT